jgi:cysteine desulfurase
MIYLDNNATTRVFDEVAEAMRPYLVDRFANPASAIGEFEGVGRAIASAKASLAKHLGAPEGNSIVVTSGATEANNLAILGAARACPARRHMIVSAIEHPSVLETIRHLESSGYVVAYLPVSPTGRVSPGSVASTLTRQTLLVSVMLANNETGIIQPVSEIADLVKAYDPRILLHTDATQAIGKMPVDLAVSLASVDLLAFSAHKFHGPKGVGALYVRDTATIAPLFFGGGQQSGLRPGTENPAAVIGMAAALTLMAADTKRLEEVRALRDFAQSRVLAICPGAIALGADMPRLPNTLNLCLSGVPAGELVDRLAARGVAISTGSACSYGAQRPSHVLLAMGLSHAAAQCCIRVSLSVETTRTEVESFLELLAEALQPTEAAARDP